ncbi:hypothetical protein LINPERPRIM_LOCUS42463 [Linum perenne]
MEDEEATGRDGVEVLKFDYSVENHFKAVDMISQLCGENAAGGGDDALDEAEIRRLSSSITFLKEWRNFRYPEIDFRVSCEAEGCGGEEGVAWGLNLPQFSSASVSKCSNDFVMYVGGPVWSLDWCPQSHERLDDKAKCEFVAIAAHPPGSCYHKIGSPLVGRGIIQIWSVLNASENKDEALSIIEIPKRITKQRKSVNDKSIKPKRSRGRPTKTKEDSSIEVKKPRGRPRKKNMPNDESMNSDNEGSNCDSEDVEPLDVEYPSRTSQRGRPRKKREDDPSEVKKPRRRPRKKLIDEPVNKPDDEPMDSINEGSNCDSEDVEPLDVEYPSRPHERGRPRMKREDEPTEVKKLRGRPRKKPMGRPRKKLIDEPVNKPTDEPLNSNSEGLNCDSQDVQPLDVEYPSRTCQRGRPKKKRQDDPTEVKKPRGRPRKKLIDEQVNRPADEPMNSNNEGSSQCLVVDKESGGCGPQKKEVRKRNTSNKAEPACTSKDGLLPERLKRKRNAASKFDDYACSSSVSETDEDSSPNYQMNAKSKQDVSDLDYACSSSVSETDEDSSPNYQMNVNSKQDIVVLDSVADCIASNIDESPCSIPKDVALPRVMLCLAHNGKVVWDLKWKPCSVSNPNRHDRMGYLAVLLGDGYLEVWDVPLPHSVKSIYYASNREGCDPRFLKLEPVFRRSVPQNGQVKSIPITVEWSHSQPNDYLLVGCHDGKVALWKFSTSGSSGDTRPSLCFSAETGPIRAITRAPPESDEADQHVILTAGHKGLKFWDLRDPFRPLWEIQASNYIYSVDWVPRPRCILISSADGTIRLLSLAKAAYDAAVYGEPTIGPLQQGMHIFNCSSYAIWSLQVSRTTGMVAYCSADGTVSRFQLTTGAVEKEPSRNRVPHFVCGSVSEDASGLLVNTPSPNTLTSIKPPNNTNSPRYLHNILSTLTPKAEKKKDPTSQTSCSRPEETLATFKKGLKKGSTANDRDTEQEKTQKKSAKCSREEPPKSSGRKRVPDNRALARVIREKDMSKEAETQNTAECLPSKLVAMHRVRWNMNKGSERWLCSGGAAGIVRCQEITLSDIDMLVAKKR